MSAPVKKKYTRIIHEGDFAAEVVINLESPHSAWGPYISTEDIRKIETVRKALKAKDISRASELAKVFKLVAC